MSETDFSERLERVSLKRGNKMFDQKVYDELKNTRQYEDFKRVRSARLFFKMLLIMFCVIILALIFNIRNPVIGWLVYFIMMGVSLKVIVEMVYLKPKTIFSAKITRVIEDTKTTASGAITLRKYMVSDGKNEYVGESLYGFRKRPISEKIPIGEKVYFFELCNGKKYVVEKKRLVAMK